MTPISIAIDGPAASGKSSLAKALASRIGLYHLETGALYRSVALAILEAGAQNNPPERIIETLDRLDLSVDTPEAHKGEIRFFLGTRDVTDDIRTEEVGKWASTVASLPAVREFLLPLQRSFSEKGRVVMDGRDIGTVILPDASLKIFLTAPAETRARRRWLQLGGENASQTLQDILEDLRQRDRQDASRNIAPLKKAPDAVDLDNSRMSVEESVNWIIGRLPE